MAKIFWAGLVGMLCSVLVHGHMQLRNPPCLGCENNPFRTDPPDPYLIYPFGCCSQPPAESTTCKGHLNLLGTPQGKPVATWAAGSSQNWSVWGGDDPGIPGGTHYGGSCQVGLSVDQGKTFKVVASYEGNCVHRHGGIDPGAASQTFNFTVPADTPAGEAVFAWNWFNREQEFNQNCAVVSISGGSGPAPVSSAAPTLPVKEAAVLTTTSSLTAAPSSIPSSGSSYEFDDDSYHCVCTKPVTPRALRRDSVHGHQKIKQRSRVIKQRTPAMAFNDRPEMMVADTNNGCMSPHTTAELKYPNPGPDVVEGDGEYPLALPSGNCG